MSMHWLACCCGGCPAELEVTFSGVDAAMCTHCRLGLSPFRSSKMTDLAVDGTYQLGFDELDIATGYCRYSLLVPSGNYGSFDRWQAAIGCPGAADSSVTLDYINIVLAINPTGNIVEELTLSTRGTFMGSNLGWSVFGAFFTGNTFDEASSNDFTCASANASSGGTATVSLP